MSTHTKRSLWDRLLRWMEGWPPDQPHVAPKPPRRSPQGEARAAGWVKVGAGYYMHPQLGTVERGRDRWTGTLHDGDTIEAPTMLHTMHLMAVHVAIPPYVAPDLVQVHNPRPYPDGHTVTVDRTAGRIVDHGDTEAVA